MASPNSEHDFSKGSVAGHILNLTVPMMLAQFVNALYNIVDRMYIGRIPDAASLALTGVGVTFPIVSIVMAFANLFATGGAPLCSIARGQGDERQAERIMGTSMSMLLLIGVGLMAVLYVVKRPLLFLLGASGETIGYAESYLTIYLLGTISVMISLGMNNFINAQGFARTGMLTTIIGAVLNLILDPIFIFVFHWGVVGAAAATVLSQTVSAVWVLAFLMGKQAILRLKRETLAPDLNLAGKICALGLSGFIMAVTNSAVQIACNTSLQAWGGDLYVGVMTVLNSVREMVTIPIQGLTNGVQPVLGFNYGAKEYRRVREGIRFTSILGIAYTVAAWMLVYHLPGPLIRMFNSEPALLSAGVPAMRLYFFGFFMMAFQFCGQSVFVGLGKSRFAVCFSLLRKVVIVLPLTLLLPHVGGLGLNGVFIAEPISNFIGGTACYGTMLLTVYRQMRREEEKEKLRSR